MPKTSGPGLVTLALAAAVAALALLASVCASSAASDARTTGPITHVAAPIWYVADFEESRTKGLFPLFSASQLLTVRPFPIASRARARRAVAAAVGS